MVNSLRAVSSIVVLTIISCSSNNNRLALSFHAPTKQVEDSIIKLNYLMCKLPTEKGSPFFKNCFVEGNGNWILNNESIGFIDKIDLNKIKALNSLVYSEKESIRATVKFLNANKVTGGFRTGENCYMYSYKNENENDYYMSKKIIVKNLSCNYLLSEYEIIDSCGNLLLLQPR